MKYEDLPVEVLKEHALNLRQALINVLGESHGLMQIRKALLMYDGDVLAAVAWLRSPESSRFLV